jgi:Clip-domain serine protease homolog Scarface
VSQDQAIPIVPAACAAAMNCTPIEYCTNIGVISKTPVVLTEFEKEYRVPLTDCMILPSREIGKCCRDPDYTDPWPIGRLGQYNADELNAVFDSGAYKPERQQNTASSRQVPVRVPAPQPRPYREISNVQAQPQQTNFQLPVQARAQAPIPATTQARSQNSFQESCGIRNYVSAMKSL